MSVKDLVTQSGTSFYWGMRLQPKPQRDAMHALYAFCRVVDDIADGIGDPNQKIIQLDAWQEVIAAMYKQETSHPLTRALAEAHEQFDLPEREFIAILDGCRMDATRQVRMETIDQLYQYVRRVAVSVGILSMQIFGVPENPGPDFATELGTAFQLTNILRDIREDAERDRLYIPLTLLHKHCVPNASLQHMLQHDNLADALCEMEYITRSHYDRSEELLHHLPRKRLRPALIMRSVYRATFDRMAARGWHDNAPLQLGRAHRLWLAIKTALAP